MKVSEVQVGDVLLNPFDDGAVYFLTSVGCGEIVMYTWLNLTNGNVQPLSDRPDEYVASEWMILRGDIVLQESSLTEDWKELLEVVK